MKFNFFLSLIALALAAVLGIMSLGGSNFIWELLSLEFLLGIQQAVSSLYGAVKYRGRERYFWYHLGVVGVYLLIWALSALSISVGEEFTTLVIFVVPWFFAVFHTYKLYQFGFQYEVKRPVHLNI